ncbi:heme peroxidase, partial [Mycena epipterygia]
GAADGSLLWDPNEVLRSENDGLTSIVNLLQPLHAQFGDVTPGDLLHLAGVLGVLACPGGPRITAWVGRPQPKNIAPTGLLPSPDDPVEKILDRFADMGFTIRDLMALVGAHSTGTQSFVDPAKANSSFDSTVDLWDVKYCTFPPVDGELSSFQGLIALLCALGVLKLHSDVNFAGNSSTSADFARYFNNQPDWDEDYISAHERLSVLGYDTATLTNCTELMPASINLTDVSVPDSTGVLQVDPTLLEAAIQKYRAPWLVPSS